MEKNETGRLYWHNGLLGQSMHRITNVICVFNRNYYINYIDDHLQALALQIERRGKLNLLDLNVHSENFYLQLFNLLYGYELINLNYERQNVESIDLIDNNKKIIIQVSATCTRHKIESSLEKEILKDLSDYTFKFISISKDASNLRRKDNYKNPYSLKFIPKDDIHDATSILNDIIRKKIEDLRDIYKFIKKELGNENEIDPVRLNSNLATIIDILSKYQWDKSDNTMNINPFEIERKINFNNLQSQRDLINEWSIYHTNIDKKYTEFDLMGNNKSSSVLSSIHRIYSKIKNRTDEDTIFSLVVEGVIEKVLDSNNYPQIPKEEIELCAEILVVDAFIRCKIFKNPDGYCYATSR